MTQRTQIQRGRAVRAARWRALILVSTLVCLSSDALANGWRQVTFEDGVRVSRKAVSGRALPVFRGVTTYNHSVLDIVTVLDDVRSHPEWLHRCVEAKVLEKVPGSSRVIYIRTDIPWPASDRDVVVKAEANIDPQTKTVELSFRAVSGVLPKKAGVVRIDRLLGLYRLEPLGEHKTRVTYQIDTDPGGWLPEWVIKKASRQLPLDTLGNLRKRLKAVGGQARRADLKARWLTRLSQNTSAFLNVDPTLSTLGL